MKYIDEFRDPAKTQALLTEIRGLVERIPRARHRPLQVMEVYGGHTHSIFRYGIQQMLPEEIEFVHGPGCPVCVLPMGRVDDCVVLAERPEVIFTTFGGAMRVPGSRKSLLKADGADVRMVYSPLDALAIARKNPGREVIFFGLGFETTMPSTAMTVIEAKRAGVRSFSLFCNHITIIPTIKAILDSPDLRLDGFLGPDHVSMVIGTRPYDFIARHYKEAHHHRGLRAARRAARALDGAQATRRRALRGGEPVRPHRPGGGQRPCALRRPRALSAVQELYELREFFEWRGLGSIDHSGVRVRAAYAECRFGVPDVKIADPKSCQCGEVLKGVIKPRDCKVFGTACTPENLLGSLMVSSEGACAAYYSYGRTARDKVQPA
jgi:hydrogenase expression/formation protein HypD